MPTSAPPAPSVVPEGRIANVDSLTALAERVPSRPLAWGVTWNPFTDPRGTSPSMFWVARDSAVWVQTSTGQSIVLDPYVAMSVGETAGERTGYETARRQSRFVGVGHEDGHLYLYLRQGAHAYAAAGALASVVVGVAALVTWLVRRLRRERRQRELLANVHHRLAESREDERMRIARDLHDGPVQDLNLVNLGLASVRPPGAGEVQALADIRVDVLRVVEELRTISEALRPPTLGPFGLASALRAHAERFVKLHPDIRVTFDLEDDRQLLPEGPRLVLFRIAQEAMTNAARHADPRSVHVELRIDPGTVFLSVSDDGHGSALPADLSALVHEGHYGLVGMRERAAAIGATLAVASQPGAGFAVQLRAHRSGPQWASPRSHQTS